MAEPVEGMKAEGRLPTLGDLLKAVQEVKFEGNLTESDREFLDQIKVKGATKDKK